MQETKCIDWQELERKVKSAIDEGCSFNLDSKEMRDREIEEWKYMQKVAEGKLSILDALFAVSIFYLSVSPAFFLYGYSNINLLYVIAGIIALALGVWLFFFYWYKRRPRCTEIILGIEKRIQSENLKKRKAENVGISTQ
ncbi:MAG: hypothetical protein OIN66_11380 [Candidatus Methanoperedens sp.]|nr:hypothetical protein [Candidatus Methanoperedens sp.]